MMKNKNNSTIHIILISLFVSLLVNFYVSTLYKDKLLTELGGQVYYQFITWLSLAQPVLITVVYNHFRKRHFRKKKEKFLKKTIDTSMLPPESKDKLDALKNDVINVQNEIDELYEEQ